MTLKQWMDGAERLTGGVRQVDIHRRRKAELAIF